MAATSAIVTSDRSRKRSVSTHQSRGGRKAAPFFCTHGPGASLIAVIPAQAWDPVSFAGTVGMGTPADRRPRERSGPRDVRLVARRNSIQLQCRTIRRNRCLSRRVETPAFIQSVGTIGAFQLTHRQVCFHEPGPPGSALAHIRASVRRPFSADRREVAGRDCARTRNRLKFKDLLMSIFDQSSPCPVAPGSSCAGRFC
jgi:hypothetical protein